MKKEIILLGLGLWLVGCDKDNHNPNYLPLQPPLTVVPPPVVPPLPPVKPPCIKDCDDKDNKGDK